MPEIIPVNSHIHYKCAFDVFPLRNLQLMTHLRQKLRSWCIEKVGENNQLMHRPWFYRGNQRTEPHYVLNGIQIRTVMAPSQDPDEPSSWAMEMIHGDLQESARRWSVEITLKYNNDGSIRFTTIIRFWMIPYYIGEYPDPPSPSTPRYVRSLLSDGRLECRRGDAFLSKDWYAVSNQDARSVFDQLISPDRQTPSIFISADIPSDRALIDPTKIMNAVIGNANLYFLPSAGVIDEMNYYLGDNLRCEPGMIRIYVPGLQYDDLYNARRHRFITRHEIAEKGPETILRYLTNGLSRNGKTFRLNDLTSFNHIFTERRKHTIKSLEAQKTIASEESQVVWEDNEQLSAAATEWETMAIQYEADNQKLESEVRSLRYRVEEADQLRNRIADLESQHDGAMKMTELPLDLPGVLTTIRLLFPERIVVTQRAFDSANDYASKDKSHWAKQEQLNIAWMMVFCVATKLFDLLFSQGPTNIEDEFNCNSTFDLAMSEGKQTKKNPRLMALRKFEHDGNTYDMTPHVKYGNKAPKLLRLYFAVDNDKKQIIIGHFGEHLENYSTRKL